MARNFTPRPVSTPRPTMSTPKGPGVETSEGRVVTVSGGGGGGGRSKPKTPSEFGGDQLDFKPEVNKARDAKEFARQSAARTDARKEKLKELSNIKQDRIESARERFDKIRQETNDELIKQQALKDFKTDVKIAKQDFDIQRESVIQSKTISDINRDILPVGSTVVEVDGKPSAGIVVADVTPRTISGGDVNLPNFRVTENLQRGGTVGGPSTVLTTLPEPEPTTLTRDISRGFGTVISKTGNLVAENFRLGESLEKAGILKPGKTIIPEQTLFIKNPRLERDRRQSLPPKEVTIGLKTPTGKQFDRGAGTFVQTGLALGAFTTPGLGTVLLGSEFVEGVRTKDPVRAVTSGGFLAIKPVSSLIKTARQQVPVASVLRNPRTGQILQVSDDLKPNPQQIRASTFGAVQRGDKLVTATFVADARPTVEILTVSKFRKFIGGNVKPNVKTLSKGELKISGGIGRANVDTGVGIVETATQRAGRATTLRKFGTQFSIQERTTLEQLQRATGQQARVSRELLKVPNQIPENARVTFFRSIGRNEPGIGIGPNLVKLRESSAQTQFRLRTRPATVAESQKTIGASRVIETGSRTLPDGTRIINVEGTSAQLQFKGLSPRSTSKISSLESKGQVLILPKPSTTEVNVISKVAKQKQAQKQVVDLATAQSIETVARIPKPKFPKVKTVAEVVEDSGATAPIMVGGLGRGQSGFRGGAAAVNENVGPLTITGPITQPPQLQTSITRQSLIQEPSLIKERVTADVGSINIANVKLSPRTIVGVAAKEEQVESLTVPVAFAQVESQAITQTQRQQQRQRLALAVRQQQRQRQIQLQPTITSTTTATPRIPLIPRVPKTPAIPPADEPISPTLKSAIGKIKNVQLQTKNFGQWVDVGKPQTFAKAKQKGIKTVSGTLRASFRLVNPQTKQPISLGRLPSGFRPSKVAPKVAVERRRRRLSTGSEVKEIQAFKRKGRSKSLFSL